MKSKIGQDLRLTGEFIYLVEHILTNPAELLLTRKIFFVFMTSLLPVMFRVNVKLACSNGHIGMCVKVKSSVT